VLVYYTEQLPRISRGSGIQLKPMEMHILPGIGVLHVENFQLDDLCVTNTH